jgi:hypothetical protein
VANDLANVSKNDNKMYDCIAQDESFGFIIIDVIDNENIVGCIFYSNHHKIIDKF